jgi:hypothetical protein
MDYTTIIGKNLIYAQLFLAIFAALLLFLSAEYPVLLILFLILFFFLTYTLFLSKTPIIGLFFLAALTLSILMLRFRYLPWGDPWYEYQMSKQIIWGNSLDPLNYPSQLPVIHISIAALSVYSGIDPLLIQKFLIPILSACGILVLYKFLEEYTNKEIALISALFLLVGTPYIHWASQAVRESVGIAFLIIALYLSYESMKKCRMDYFIAALIAILGLLLTHHLSNLFFLLIWLSISLSYIYCVCEMKSVKKSTLFSLGIFLIYIFSTLFWWNTHLPSQYVEFETLMNKLFSIPYGIVFFIVCIITLYILPIVLPKILIVIRYFLSMVFSRKKEVYAITLIISVILAGVIYNFVMGKSFFITSYPGYMLINGIIMAFLAIIGLYYCLNLEKFPLVCWLGMMALVIVLTMAKIVPFVDPFRILEFLWIPLAIVSAIGFVQLFKNIKSERIKALVIAGIVTISIITAYPSIVFFNTPFNPGNPLYDTRSLVISHPDSEIIALNWLETNNVSGIIETDTYIGYAGRALVNHDNVTWQTYFRLGNPDDPLKSYYYNSHQNYYAIISGRMSTYAEFGEDWSKNKTSLKPAEIENLNQENNLIYDNGENKIFYSNLSV